MEIPSLGTTYRIVADDASQSLESIWPPFGLRIESPRLVLRVVRESDFPQWVAAASSGVTQTDRNPFDSAWNENDPEELVKSSLPFLWSTRGKISAQDWALPLGVFLKGEASNVLIGMQDCFAKNWKSLKTVNSGSWLRTDQQGQGYGKEMRAAMLMWAFDSFAAEYAESGAYSWNERSRAVSEGLGYRTVGTERVTDAHDSGAELLEKFRMHKDEFIRPDWEVAVYNSERLAEFLGLTQDSDTVGDA